MLCAHLCELVLTVAFLVGVFCAFLVGHCTGPSRASCPGPLGRVHAAAISASHADDWYTIQNALKSRVSFFNLFLDLYIECCARDLFAQAPPDAPAALGWRSPHSKRRNPAMTARPCRRRILRPLPFPTLPRPRLRRRSSPRPTLSPKHRRICAAPRIERYALPLRPRRLRLHPFPLLNNHPPHRWVSSRPRSARRVRCVCFQCNLGAAAVWWGSFLLALA